MMQFVMQPGMVYRYPLWGVALLLMVLAAGAAVGLERAVRRLVSVEFRRGGLTIAFGSFLGVSSLGMHLAMSAVLAVSGTLVLIPIIALSNPFRGDFRVSTLPFDPVLALIEATPSHP
jgi:hypothetical protein